MLTVGLTGGIAAGKSTVAQRFVEHGMELVDADAIAREVVVPGTRVWKRIVEHFGESILDEQGFIDRPALGRLVFGDPDKRAVLNGLTHPPVIEEIANRLELLQCFDGVVVLDVPLLVEVGASRGEGFGEPPFKEGFGEPPFKEGFGEPPFKEGFGEPPFRCGFGEPPFRYDAVVVVATEPETQIARLCRDRGMSETDAHARVAAQAPLRDKLAVATHVIWNEGTLAELQEATDLVATDLLKRARAKTDAETADIPDN
ncbi:MAG: dephospho-CoA kinase [Egibacteraceae bacterium]